MEYSYIQLNNLPDEILIYIFKKLSNAEILYSLSGVNKRLNKIAHDSIFTSHLSLLRRCPDHSIYPLTDSMLDRFCSKILPEIHYKIKWINLESSSMKYILYAADYPNLNGLRLYNIEEKTAKCFFTGKQISIESFLLETNETYINTFISNLYLIMKF